MKFHDGLEVTNELLEYIYPQRFMRGENYEFWRFPYVKDGVVEEWEDFVLVLLNGKKNYAHIFTPSPEHAKDRAYISRVIWLVHDISEEFDTEFHVIKDWEDWNPNDHMDYVEQLVQDFLKS